MFDSNAFSSLLNSNIDWTSFFSMCEGKYEFYVTALQIEELSEIPDSKKRNSNPTYVMSLPNASQNGSQYTCAWLW